MQVREAIEQFHGGKLGGYALMRALVGHGSWRVPAAAVGQGVVPVVRHTDGERWYPAFTDDKALRLFEVAAGRSVETWLELPGLALFGSLTDDLDGIDVNPLNPDALHYRRHQLATFRGLARAIVVERILAGTCDGDDDLELLRRYDGYRVVYRETDDGAAQLGLAPDAGGRRLAAVFTAEDAVEPYLELVGGSEGIAPIVVTRDGGSLFAELTALPLDGIVFNCRGPVPPRAVALGFAALVLDRGR